ncbi:Endonuclease/exonuclease/phosphatase, partial [Mycena albidolilacea]
KAYIKISSLNMRGRFHRGEDKWLRINQIMRDRKIGVLAVQETHFSPADVDDVHKLFSKRLQVFATIDPTSPQSKGVAIVVNKEVSNIVGIKTKVIIPGRALHLTIPWHGDQKLTILAAYAPNDSAENTPFLSKIEEKTRGLAKPDISLGDWNMVEDSMDRIPHHSDPSSVTDVMRDFKSKLGLIDGWRQTFPDSKAFTFLQTATGSQSRIDRILVTDRVFRNSYDWQIESPGIHTDHQLVSVKFSDPKMPFIGKGRWAQKVFLLTVESVMERINTIGLEYEAGIADSKTRRTDDNNPQLIMVALKEAMTEIFRQKEKTMIPKMEKEIKNMKKKLQETLNDTRLNEDERKAEGASIQENVDATERLRFQKARDNAAARNRLDGETTATKYWTSVNKERAPRDTILSLLVPGSDPPVYQKRSDKMAEIARDFHDKLQTEDIASPAEREAAEAKAFENIKKLSQQSKAKLSQYLTRGDIIQVLKKLPNGKAPGIDGLIHELWKTLHSRFEKAKEGHKRMDIAGIFKAVFNDIEKYGVHPDTNFAEGWMSLLHKKNDKRNVSNYRPITLLNTDYKIFTKALAIKL